MRYFSMFSGIGGFELGIGKRGVCVGYSEIDKYAIQTYEEHYGHKNYGDATTINPAELPAFDLLVGGFPCQSFSVAGKRRGFNDTRGTLFFDIARVLRDKRPRHLVLENVKGLLSHDEGKTFQTILGVLADLGYRVEWQVLNSKDFGVPQNRERVFIIGHLREECGRKVLPIRGTDTEDVQASGEEQERRTWVSTLDSRYGERWSTETYVRHPLRFLERNQKNIEGDYAYTVDASQTGGVAVMEGFGETRESTLSPTLRTPSGGRRMPMVKQQTKIRRLTPKECERLQGFPDNWTLGSDTQRYKQCGNAVTTNVVEAVITAMQDCLGGK